MALTGKMKKGKLFLLFFTYSLIVFVTVCEGSKEKKLEHLVQDFKGESDKVANEIYAWIDKHSKGLQSHDYARHQSRDHLKSTEKHVKTDKKENIQELIKALKGESDHIANEIYAWIDKHRKGFLSRGKSRDQLRGHALGKSRDNLRSRRSVETQSSDGNDFEGESIQDVMRDLMNAPHPEKKRHETKYENKKTKKSLKRKLNKKAKHATIKKKSKKGNKKNRIQKRVKHVSPSKKSKVSMKKKTSSAHVIKAVKKSGGLADLLKVISADPSKKIVVTKGKNDVTLDRKSLKFFNGIPKPLLQKLIENVEVNKFFNIDTYISGEKGKSKTKRVKKSKAGKTSKKIVSKKKILKKVVGKSLRKHHGKKSLKAHDEKKPDRKAVKAKKQSRKGKKKLSFSSKKAKKFAGKAKMRNNKLRRAKKNEEHADSKSKVFKHRNSKKSEDILNDKKRDKIQGNRKKRKFSNVGHQKLAELKDKIKKTNSLKFRVAKALLKHCETQNKLKMVFDNVNASLKEASHLAKAIGKKFGIKKSDLDKLTTKHTEEAVQEFLNKIF